MTFDAARYIYRIRRRILTYRWEQLRRANPLITRLNLGCGTTRFENHFNIDIVPSAATDLVADIANLDFMRERDYFDLIRLDAVFEHFWKFQQEAFLAQCHLLLKRGGSIQLNWLPDFEVITASWQEKADWNGQSFSLDHVYRYTHGEPNYGNRYHQIHKAIFTKDSIRQLLMAAGFTRIEIENKAYGSESIALNMMAEGFK